MSTTPQAVKVRVAAEQGGIPPVPAKTICPFCNQPGAAEPHHWLFKRSRNVPDEVLHDATNVVMLCKKCHDRYGQTKEMFRACLVWKVSKGYRPGKFMADAFEKGLIKRLPYSAAELNDILSGQPEARQTQSNRLQSRF